MDTIHKIKLHGELANAFGDEFKFAGHSPAEMIKFLMYQVKGFADKFKDGYYRVVKNNEESGFHYDEQSLHCSLGDVPSTIHLIPSLQGSGGGSGGGGKAILGGVIMVAAVATAWFTGGASLYAGGLSFGTSFSVGMGATAFAGFSYGTIALLGGAMLLGGLAMALQPAPDMGSSPSRERPEARPSYFLNGAINMMEQGGALPILYGKYLAGSVVINASVEVYDV